MHLDFQFGRESSNDGFQILPLAFNRRSHPFDVTWISGREFRAATLPRLFAQGFNTAGLKVEPRINSYAVNLKQLHQSGNSVSLM